jgi:hypothetical protein
MLVLFVFVVELFREQLRGRKRNHGILCCPPHTESVFHTITLSQIALSASLAAGFFVMNQ